MNTVFQRALLPLAAAAIAFCPLAALADTVYPSGTPLASQVVNTPGSGLDTVP